MLLAVLAIALVAQFAIPGSRPPRLAGGAMPLPAPLLFVGAAPGYPQILARPLFSPTRSMVGEGSPAGAQLSDFSVVGTAIARGVALAFVRGPDGKMQTLRIGEQLLDWRLVAIRRDAVVIQAQNQQRVIPVTGSAAATAAPVGLR